MTKRVIERLDAGSGILSTAGQYAYYGRVGGCPITRNDDGIKHCAPDHIAGLDSLPP